MKGAWKCGTCQEIIRGSWASAERHADAHGGARLEQVVSVVPESPETFRVAPGGTERPLRGPQDAA